MQEKMLRILGQRASIVIGFAIVACLFGLFARSASAATFTVINTNDSGMGSLRQAIADAASGDTVNFNLSGCPCTIALTSGELVIEKNLTILGLGADRLAVSGNHLSRVFFIVSGQSLQLSGLTLSDGNGVGRISGLGGGIFNDGGAVILTNIAVSGNSGAGSGGGIFTRLGPMTLTNCTVSGNSSSSHGGGIYNIAGSLTLTNSTVSGNAASTHAGGIANAGNLMLVNSTVVSNRSDAVGNGVGIGGGIYSGGTEDLKNTIVAGNFRGTGSIPDDFAGTVDSASNNLIGDAGTSGGIINGLNSNIVGNNGSGTIDINSVLNTTLAYNGGSTKTHSLVPGSPALNAGSNSLLPPDTFDLDGDGDTTEPLPVDQRGVYSPRIGHGTVDIGAFEGAVWVVTKTADTYDQVCDADCSLSEAVYGASPGDTILFSPLFDTPQTISIRVTLFTFIDLKILGPGADKLTISGSNNFRVFDVRLATVWLDGLTVSNGLATTDSFGGGGGGIRALFSSTLTVTNSTISDNYAFDGSGGGIYSRNSILKISNCLVSGNRTRGLSGGGIFSDHSVTITDSTITGNSANSAGGGILNQGLANVINSTISDNSLTFGNGAGIANFNTLNIINSTVSGNSAQDNGGGIANSATLSITNSTVAGNRADNTGAGNRSGGGIYGSATETVNSTIVAGNVVGIGTDSDDISGVMETANNDLIGDSTTSGDITNGTNGNIVGNNGLGTIDINTVLDTALADNGGSTMTHALICGSPAIDKGMNFSDLITDQRGYGFGRIFDDVHVANAAGGDGTDIGAFELQTGCNTAPTAVDDSYSINEDSPLSISATGVLGNDSDAQNDPLTAVLVSGPSHAQSFTLNADGSFSYTPAANYNGSDSFTYEANDGSLDSNTATVRITVNAVNDPPTVMVVRGGSCSGTSVTGTMNLLLADVDSPISSLTIGGNSSNTSLVANSGIVFGGSGASRTVTITVQPKRTGTAVVTMNVSDGQAAGSVAITVIVGSDKNETLNGTSGADMIFGLGGKNTINGNAGNDLLCGGNGVDIISGGDGDDTIDGGNGDDVISGGTGNDVLIGGAGNDQLFGGDGDDTLTGGTGADFFSGGSGTNDVATDFTPSQGDTKDGTIP